MATIEQAQALVTEYCQAGDYRQAESLCLQILGQAPSNPDALHAMGVIGLRQGNAQAAIPYLQRSISLQPSRPLFHSNLGCAWNVLGDQVQAVACFERALQIDPNFQQAHVGMAAALSARGEFVRAEAHCQTALRLRPDCAEAWNSMGNIGRLQGRWAQAADCFQRALTFDARHAHAQNNLAAALHMLGRKREAMAGYRQCLKLNPDYAGAHNNLATLLQEEGNLDEAEFHLRHAMRLQPPSAENYNNLGGVLQQQARLDEAIACFRNADALIPPGAVPSGNLLLCLNYLPRADSAMLLAEHRRWGERAERIGPVSPLPARDRSLTRALRVGYVSPDLCSHASANFVVPILAHHDPAQVEVFCYAEVPAPDRTTERMKQSARGWRFTVGLTDSALADLIRADQIDILVDLGGHTSRSRVAVFSRKPAPVQVTYLGYPNTTGLKTIDYRLTDAIADPPGEPVAHTEELFRLPRGFCCYAPNPSDPPVGPLPADRAGYVTFGSLHTLQRLNRGVLDTWCALLRAAPSARLLVFRHTLRGKVHDELLRYLTSQGIAAERIDLQCKVQGPGGYPGVYHHVDISLDTFPWSGHSTGCQSLWMGVPMVTLRGTRFASRMMASVLHHAGLGHLVANTPEQYVEVAARLAADIEGLAKLRANLREQISASALFDAVGFTRELEQSYRQMWQRWISGA